MFKYEWTVEEENDIERDKVVTEISKSTNVFKQAARKRKVVLNFCEKNGKQENQVTVKEVAETKLGLQGRADAGAPQLLRGGKEVKHKGAAKSLARRSSDASNAGTSDGNGDDEGPTPKTVVKAKAKGNAKAKAGAKLRAADVDKKLKNTKSRWRML